MTDLKAFLAARAPAAHAVLRVSAGLLYGQHGVQKLFGWLGGFGGTPGGRAELVSQMGLAGVIETGGGLLLIAGLFVRPAAAIIAVEMVWAYFQAHFPQGGWPLQNRGELPLLYAAICAFLAVHGAGPYSVDDAIKRKTTA